MGGHLGDGSKKEPEILKSVMAISGVNFEVFLHRRPLWTDSWEFLFGSIFEIDFERLQEGVERIWEPFWNPFSDRFEIFILRRG